jgi:hypothetical protein
MLHQVAADTGSDMRVLLLARQAGEWWQRLGAEPMVRAMIADADHFREELLDQIDAAATDFDVVLRAMPCFAARLEVPSHHGGKKP